MSNDFDDIRMKFEEFCSNREMDVPKFSDEEINQLPNILQLIGLLNQKEQEILIQDQGWQDYSFSHNMPDDGLKLSPFPSLYSSDRVYINNIDDNKFIVNRLSSKRFCFKPNLRSHRFLFRGQNQHYPKIVSSFERKSHDEKLLSNIQVYDFVCMLRTHPLFMLFEQGIHLSPVKKPFFFEMNYYGLAQHYNFNTGLIDFTSDIYAAAFFATTKNDGDDKYKVYDGKSKYGVIYVHEIIPKMSFTPLFGFRTIGHQIYPRTGAQHGFFYQEPDTKIPVEKCVRPYYFRHDSKCAEMLFAMMKNGEILFPKDDLAPLSFEIRHSNSVTGQAFCNNLYCNQDEMQVNIKRLKELGINVDWHQRRMFNIDMLQQYYANIKNGWWEEFCNKIAFADKDESELMESLLRLPDNPHYSQYFNPKYLNLLYYFNQSEHVRAMINKRRYQHKNL